MQTISPEIDLATIVINHPSVAPIFEKLGFDFCCGGRQTLEQACRKKGLETNSIIQALLQECRPTNEVDLSKMSQSELVEHIIKRHHEYLRSVLPTLQRQLVRVCDVHGTDHPELLEVFEVFQRFSDDLYSHMQKEEQILFPMLLGLQSTSPNGCSVPHIISIMEMEHDEAGGDLQKMHHLTSGYKPPEGACGTYRSLLAGLSELEHDMHVHVHAENHILFPKALGGFAESA